MFELRPARNVIEIAHPCSDAPILLYCRKPTGHEMVLYRAEQMEREGDSILQRTFETRVKYGAAILQGFESGAFAVHGQLISSDPASAFYRPDWKELLASEAPEILEALAWRMFEGTRAILVRQTTEKREEAKAQAGLAGQEVERVAGPLAPGSAAA